MENLLELLQSGRIWYQKHGHTANGNPRYAYLAYHENGNYTYITLDIYKLINPTSKRKKLLAFDSYAEETIDWVSQKLGIKLIGVKL